MTAYWNHLLDCPHCKAKNKLCSEGESLRIEFQRAVDFKQGRKVQANG